MALKEAYTTRELAEALCYSTTRSVFLRAEREAWQFRKRAGRGGGKEWLVASMPEETRLAIRTAEEKHAAAVCSERRSVLPMTTTTAIMDDSRRYKALAKADLVRQYLPEHKRMPSSPPTRRGHGPSSLRKSGRCHGRRWNGGSWSRNVQAVCWLWRTSAASPTVGAPR